MHAAHRAAVALAARLRAEDLGQTMVEYGLILVFISIAAVLSMGALGIAVGNPFTAALDAFP